MWLLPPLCMFANSTNSAMKALQAGSYSDAMPFLVSSTHLRLPGFMASSIHSPAHGTTLYHHHSPPPKRGNGRRSTALAAPRVRKSCAAALIARSVKAHRIVSGLAPCVVAAIDRSPAEPWTYAEFPSASLPSKHCTWPPPTPGFAGVDDRVFPGVTMLIDITACTDTPTDNRFRRAVAVYVPKAIPATEVENSAKIADCMQS